MLKNQTPLAILSLMVCEVLWGFSFLFTKSVTDSIAPLTLLSWRFIVALAVMGLLALFGIIKLDLRKKSLGALLLPAVFHPVLYFIGETFGVKLTTASESGAIIACIPISALVCSTLILKESPTKRQITGVGLSIVGVFVIVMMKDLSATLDPAGYLMLLIAVASYGFYSVFAQRATQFTSAEKTFAMIALGAAVFTSLALAQNAQAGTLKEFVTLPFTDRGFLGAVAYLGIGCSVVAFFLYNVALSALGTNRTAPFAGLTTVVTVIAGVAILNESFSPAQVLGTAAVLGGVYLASITTSAKKRGPAASLELGESAE
jgi:drug/metabolite transporter (DMT)-like permease